MLKKSIWVSILFLLIGGSLSYLGYNKRSHIFFSVGWVFFGLYWLALPLEFIAKEDYFNAFLTAFSSLLAWSVAFIQFRYHERFHSELIYLSKAAGIAALFYFPYHFVSTIQITLAQEFVAQQTFYLLKIFTSSVELNKNVILFSGEGLTAIEITYACTGLGSMALFVGAIIPSKDKLKDKMKVLLVSCFIIYVLNLIRNVFVVFATGEKLFTGWNILGLSGSYNIAHNFFAKIGSIIALVAIAYYVLLKLPKLKEVIFDLIELPNKIKKMVI